MLPSLIHWQIETSLKYDALLISAIQQKQTIKSAWQISRHHAKVTYYRAYADCLRAYQGFGGTLKTG